jgi:hypothetical protein
MIWSSPSLNTVAWANHSETFSGWICMKSP